jgi:Fe-S cluster biogenesis protein NfuA
MKRLESPLLYDINLKNNKKPEVYIMLRDRVEEALDGIRPALQADGGDVELVDIDEENGIVTVQLQGACSGCPSAQITLAMGVERAIKEKVPEIKEVRST